MTLSLTESDPRPAEGEGYVADFHLTGRRLAEVVKTLTAHDWVAVMDTITMILDAKEK